MAALWESFNTVTQTPALSHNGPVDHVCYIWHEKSALITVGGSDLKCRQNCSQILPGEQKKENKGQRV